VVHTFLVRDFHGFSYGRVPRVPMGSQGSQEKRDFHDISCYWFPGLFRKLRNKVKPSELSEPSGQIER